LADYLRKKMPDEMGKLLAGQLGLAAVIANVLIDKGIITREELCERLHQAHDAALKSSAGPLGAQVLAGLPSYLERNDKPSKPRLQ
jgi:hypothetical protein